MRARLFPLATVLTPNIPEAASLCGTAPAADREGLLQQARALVAMGAHSVLLKGGHAAGAEAVDLLFTAQDPPQWLSSPRVEARCRGTGCALASAIAAGLASGQSVADACRNGKQYVLSMLAARAF
jgi:hydroxymethylpyrimidine/phosphomethylpyrimidine kinase